MKRIDISKIETAADVENYIYDVLGDWDMPVLGVGKAKEQVFFPYISFLIWAIGKPYGTVEVDKGDVIPGPYKWARPLICITENQTLKEVVADRFYEVIQRPEECSRSIYDIPFILADIEIFGDPNYSYLHSIGLRRIAVVDKPVEEYAPADIYLLINPLVFYSIPDNLEGDFLFFPFPPVCANQFDFTVKWTSRRELCVVLDKTVLPTDAYEGYRGACAHLNIPLITEPVRENLREYKFAIYPVGAEVSPLHVPTGLKEAILSNCIVVTNCAAVHVVASAEVSWDFTDNGDILAVLLDKYIKEREKWGDPQNRVTAITENIKNLTLEGILLGFTGNIV